MNKFELAAFVITLPTIASTIVALAYIKAKRLDREARPRSPLEDQRLARIEQAVESIAVEVERISEAQRFTAKLMAEGRRAPEALPAADYQGGSARG